MISVKENFHNSYSGNRVREDLYYRVRTHPGKPGKYWNLIIRIPGLEYTGILSKVLENTGIRAYF